MSVVSGDGPRDVGRETIRNAKVEKRKVDQVEQFVVRLKTAPEVSEVSLSGKTFHWNDHKTFQLNAENYEFKKTASGLSINFQVSRHESASAKTAKLHYSWRRDS